MFKDPSLEKFIKFVPFCKSPHDLETIILSFQHYQSDFLVVVNENHVPLGIIAARTVLQWQREQCFSFDDVIALLSPIFTLSEEQTLPELLPYLEAVNTDEKILVVDQAGALKGQLDIESILQLLLRQQPVAQSSPVKATPLLDFLEKLPLPLMLQTETGELLHQNASWRNKICCHREHCCLLTVDAPENGEKQWCNVISHGSAASERQSVFPDNQQKHCPWFPASGTGSEGSNGNCYGVWQFITLSLADTAFGSCWLVLATDITEQRQLCKELAAKNADLVQLNRLKDEFLACITHELKSPLTAIVGLSNLLNENSIGELNQRQQRYVNQIYQSGRQLMNLVNDLLDLARLETGQLQLHPEAVELKQVCDRAYEQAQQQTPESEPPYTLNIAADLDTIVADEIRLRQMLAHLLANARKFTGQEGEMGLDVTEWEGWIAFTVWDTGMGIPEASQHLIFEKFQQLEDPMTRQFSGTGLGLVLTQRLAQAHGGDVSFISEEGKGSQFTLLLPSAPAPKTFHPQACSPQTAGKLVLVVEAVPQYLKTLTEQLQELGYRVAIARSGTEALLKARTFQPCTILLNPVLPLLSGWDVLTLLKSHSNSSKIPVVVTGTRREKEKALNNGADGFLTRPIANNDLQDALSACAAPRSLYRKSVTVLRLHYSPMTAPPKRDPVAEILSTPPQSASHRINYRILEADDPEQAELLQRIWHPDVLLLSGEEIPYTFLEQVSQQETLSHLPLVCLDSETAKLAHQAGNLSVYPCFNLNSTHSQNTLWSVLQFAAGINTPPSNTAPYIVVVDGRYLSGSSPHHSGSEWLNAFIQYLTAAGYCSSLAHSWTEIYQQVQQQGADLLVLDLEGTEASFELIQGLQQLSTINNLPIIALASPTQLRQQETLNQLLQDAATQILPGHSHAMQELLNRLEQQLASRKN
ncbi:MAG: hybrid sensor histidine kinase/response regulator [Cyanobacteria bacterium SW_9_44_58]|nr:MAG: hybrid sensor histidine kinase/response regulator [Cyanobacteria bacterium SW_9_44_58]